MSAEDCNNRKLLRAIQVLTKVRHWWIHIAAAEALKDQIAVLLLADRPPGQELHRLYLGTF